MKFCDSLNEICISNLKEYHLHIGRMIHLQIWLDIHGLILRIVFPTLLDNKTIE